MFLALVIKQRVLAGGSKVMTHHGSGLHSHASMQKVLTILQDAINNEKIGNLKNSSAAKKAVLKGNVEGALNKIRISIEAGTF
jgi:hypothetical protein